MARPLTFGPHVNGAKLEALIGTMYLAAQADGEFSGDERTHFVASVQSLTDHRLEGDALEALLRQLEQDRIDNGRERCLAAIAGVLSDASSRKLALSMAARMIASDGVIEPSEREFLAELAGVLQFDAETARAVLEDSL